MSITNYGELRTHFLALLNRSDCTNALADTFLTMGFNRLYRQLRIPEMEKVATLTAGTDSDLTIPSDYLEMRSLYYGNVKFTKDEDGDFRLRSVADGDLTYGPIRYIREN